MNGLIGYLKFLHHFMNYYDLLCIYLYSYIQKNILAIDHPIYPTWLVVWNMNFIFPSIGNFIIPTDKVHHFSEG